MKTNKPRHRRWHIFLLLYLALLLISHIIRLVSPPDRQPDAGQKVIEVRETGNDATAGKTVRIAYFDDQPATAQTASVVLVLHGSPVGVEMFPSFLPELAKTCRVITPEYPGYGNSTRDVPDYSARTFADYMIQLLDRLEVDKIHLIAYSFGGAVGLQMAEMVPERIASLTMLSAFGVQELELLGDYHLNHAIHGLQLAGLWVLHELIPHFGVLDNFPLNIPYARSFYDTDQRPLRNILENFQQPMLIVHGESDGLVPPEAAREHYRIVPQSELKMYPQGHGLVINQGPAAAADISGFILRVEKGEVLARSQATPERLALAAQPLDAIKFRRAEGLTVFVIMLMLALATLISEDLACIGGGLLAARGIIGFWPATIACFLGIFIGDILLYLAGRWLGRPALKYPPLKWFIKEDDVIRSNNWFAAKGPQIIIASRFLPGTRLPTYFAAGMFEAGFWMFTIYFFFACAIWTPLLVGLAMLLGNQLFDYFSAYQNYVLWMLLGILFFFWLIRKVVIPLFSFKGRRLLFSAWRRKVRWEFWPPYVFYVPLLFYVLYLGIRYRSLTVFTAANPAIPDGGFVGESKSEILAHLKNDDEFVARYHVLDHQQPTAELVSQIKEFMQSIDSDYPVVLKPDVGERGNGVLIAYSETDVKQYLTAATGRSIVQEYVPGVEFGVFYIRYPSESSGRIFSITDKRFVSVTGDGKSTLEELILKDDRAVCMARFYLDKHRENLYEIPGKEQKISLVELGTHCKGALFLNGMSVHTSALETAIERISQNFEGFYFGRYDIRTPFVEDFKKGRNFKIVELNGVTSEATHIYDPQNSLFYAYRTLMQQWKTAFEIGARNAANGAEPTPVLELLRKI